MVHSDVNLYHDLATEPSQKTEIKDFDCEERDLEMEDYH